METEPNPTLYINNINEKIKKEPLKKLLYMLFSQYGKVRQIITRKGIKMRGQAWVIFNDTISATNALKGKQGFKLYGKELRIQFAKAKSHIILRKEGIPIEKAGATQPLGGKRGREEEADEDEPVTKDARTV